MKYLFFTLLFSMSAFSAPAESSDAIKLPKVVVCQHGHEDLKLYTRMETIRSLAQLEGDVVLKENYDGLAQPEDESATQDNDYLAARIESGTFKYFAYSCDTTDYTYTIPVNELVEGVDSPVQTKIVRMHYNANTRGEDDEDRDLGCRAEY